MSTTDGWSIYSLLIHFSRVGFTIGRDLSMGLNRRSHFAVLILLLALLCPPAISVSAGNPPQAGQPSLADLEDLETFLDGLVSAQRSAYHVPGVTISIVKDGRLIFAKGYGYADLERRIPVQADQILFRPGSVSKLFTWTAVMQLVEQGKLDLDADVNAYLDFTIPPAFDKPVTLRHLLTHTPGFEDQGLGLFSRSPEDLLPLGEFLAGNVPDRVFPPGEISAYSNYGAGLAGYIVERASGLPFEAYVEANIFQPLGMAHSTFRQPLPTELAPDMSKGYRYTAGRYEEGPFEFVQPAPAGALSATASDLAAFMIAHLQNGRYSGPNGDAQILGAQILQEETARQMHTLQFAHDERLPGWGEGFSVAEVNGLPTFGHGGDTIYFHSDMLLLPEENLGVFISTNSDQGVWMRHDFIQRFFERYYPAETGETPQPPADFQQRASQYAGTYFPARMSFSGVEKTLNLVQPVNIQATPEGELRVTGLLGPQPTYWVELEPMVFTSVSGNLPEGTLLVFKAGGAPGEEDTQYAFFFDGAYIRQPWYGANSLHLGLLGLSLFIFLSAVIAYPARGLVRRHYRKTYPDAVPPTPLGERLALWAGWVFALLSLLFWVIFSLVMSDLNSLVFGLPPAVNVLMVIPYVLGVLAAGLLVFAVLAWVKKYWTVSGRIFYTLLALAAAAHMWFLSYWNLI